MVRPIECVPATTPPARSLKGIGTIVVVTLACLCTAGPARSRNLLKDLGKDLGKIVMRVDRAAVSKEVVDKVADVGEPKRVAARKDQTVGELVRSQCGSVDENYIELLRRSNPAGLPEDFGVDSKFETDADLELPACLRFASDPTVAHAEPEVWSEVELKDPSQRPKAITDLRRALEKSGQKSVPVEDPSQIHLYSSLAQDELDTLGACQQPRDATGALLPIDPPFNPVELLQVLTYNLSRLASTQRGTPVTIVIPDTGLYTDGNPPFPSHRIDRIGAAGNPLDRDEGIRPYPEQMHHQHGTNVASLALGGPQFMQLLDALDLKLRVAPFNILTEAGKACAGGGTAKCPDVRTDVFNNAVDFADRANAIVNLSVGRQVKVGEIYDALGAGSDVLFVVAAGNDHESLDVRRVYPASYGGRSDGQYNLITVAATDLDGRRAPFSNFGERYVDIAAPGCMQSVLEYDAKTKGHRLAQASGTSFAAPLVSFTAALLRSVWPNTSPRSIKKRILSAADISPLLSPNDVAQSRRLSVTKTLAIFQDVVDARIDGKTQRVRGRIDSTQSLFDFCDGMSLHRERGVNQNTVRKIAPVTQPTPGLRIDWETYDGVWDTKLCPMQELSIGITDTFTGTHYSIKGSDIIDVVFAETQ